MVLIKFIGGFTLGFLLIGAIVGVVLWLLTLIVSVLLFSWPFVLIIAGIAGMLVGFGFALAD